MSSPSATGTAGRDPPAHRFQDAIEGDSDSNNHVASLPSPRTVAPPHSDTDHVAPASTMPVSLSAAAAGGVTPPGKSPKNKTAIPIGVESDRRFRDAAPASAASPRGGPHRGGATGESQNQLEEDDQDHLEEYLDNEDYGEEEDHPHHDNVDSYDYEYDYDDDDDGDDDGDEAGMEAAWADATGGIHLDSFPFSHRATTLTCTPLPFVLG